MAAPSGTVWGDIVGGYGRIGIYVKLTNTNPQTTRETQVWFWSKYSVSDKTNTLYCDDNATTATSSAGSVSISTYTDSGEGWSTSNQQRLVTYTYTFNRGTSAKTYPVAAKLTGVDRVGGTMTASTTYTIPALPSYTITYNANGGTGAPGNQTKYYGKNLTLSSTKPTRSGYTFIGWGSSKDDTTPVNQPGGTYTGNAKYTYYAIWLKTITLSYSANGGGGAPSAQTATVYNATTSYKFTLPSGKPTRTGHTFLGWSTSSSATSSSYSPGGTITLSSSDVLYAVWKANTYSITYNANGGSGAPSDQTKTHGVTLTLSSTKPTKTGYTFVGWGLSKTTNVAVAQPGGTYSDNEARAFYAIWKKTIVLSYNANGGTGAPANQSKTIYNSTTVAEFTISTTKPTRTGYTFIGWHLSATATNADYNYDPGKTAWFHESMTLYAVWQINTYKISYNANGGSGTPSTQKKTYGVDINISTTIPTRKGYKFLGWSRDATSGTIAYYAGANCGKNENMTLYAVWERLGIAHININGAYNQGRIWVNDNGTWKTGIIFVNISGNWKQGGA